MIKFIKYIAKEFTRKGHLYQFVGKFYHLRTCKKIAKQNIHIVYFDVKSSSKVFTKKLKQILLSQEMENGKTKPRFQWNVSRNFQDKPQAILNLIMCDFK